MKPDTLSIAALIIFAFCCTLACHQAEPPPKSNTITVSPSHTPLHQDVEGVSLDKSPMDMSYYPVDYTKQKMVRAIEEPLIARVIYSRPKKDNRLIFGDVIKYGSPWRLGANEATEVEFFSDVRINNESVREGRYIMYCIPYPDKWRIVLNSDLYTWGLKFDSTRDVHRFTVPVQHTNTPFERFTMEFEKSQDNKPAVRQMQLHIAWDSVFAELPISY